jgi:hypothetical protein
MKMITPNTMVPPALPSNEALATAMTLLAIAADPQKTKSRLAELNDQLGAVQAAHDELAAERKSVEAAQAKLASLEAAQAKLAADQAAVVEAHTQLAVATAAVSGREQAAGEWEARLTKYESDLASREQALAARVQSYRRGLEA